MGWDAEGYSRRVGSLPGYTINARENQLLSTFPPLRGAEDIHNRERLGQQLPLVAGPCTVVDIHGKVMLWSLPGILPPRMRVMQFV